MMNTKMIEKYCAIGGESREMLRHAIETIGLSARAYHRILKLARTIADLEGAENISTDHIFEAIQYRSVERE